MNKDHDYNILMVPISQIAANPNQPRKVFDKDMLEELKNSIKEFGVIQPINVRKIDKDKYELVAGERRLRAAKLANLEKIPAIIIEVNDKDSAVLALIENLQRENLNYFEEAEGYYNLMAEYNLIQEDIARQVGKSQSTIANKLRLLKLSDKVVKILLDEELSERHARALLKLPSSELQIFALDRIVSQSLNVKRTEELIEYMLGKDDDEDIKNVDASNPMLKKYFKDIRVFTSNIKQSVELMREKGMDIKYALEEGEDEYHISIRIPMNK